MVDHLRANVVGYVALFVALSGTAIALPGKNTVDSGDIKEKTVKTSDLAPKAVKESRLAPDAVSSVGRRRRFAHGRRSSRPTRSAARSVDESSLFNDDSLTGADVDESTLGQVPAAANAANAGQLGGVGPNGYLRCGGTIPSGVTITGRLPPLMRTTTSDVRALSESCCPRPSISPTDK